MIKSEFRQRLTIEKCKSVKTEARNMENMKNRYNVGASCAYILVTVVLLVMAANTVVASGVETISVGGDTSGVVGDSATIYISATGVNGLGSINFDVLYDHNIIGAISVTEGNLTSGAFLVSGIHDTEDNVQISLMSLGGISGSGTIAKISYNIKKVGSTALTISGCVATDTDANSINIGSITGSSFDAIAVVPTVTVTPIPGDILAYYRGLGNDKGVVETTDLLTAANDWRTNIIPPGFSVSITTVKLLTLADEWRIS
jgi:Cohesin domain